MCRPIPFSSGNASQRKHTCCTAPRQTFHLFSRIPPRGLAAFARHERRPGAAGRGSDIGSVIDGVSMRDVTAPRCPTPLQRRLVRAWLPGGCSGAGFRARGWRMPRQGARRASWQRGRPGRASPPRVWNSGAPLPTYRRRGRCVASQRRAPTPFHHRQALSFHASWPVSRHQDALSV